MTYTGTSDEIRFKQLLEKMLEKNELDGASPYVLKWAGTAESGWSFGTVQFDIGANPIAQALILDIITNAQSAPGIYIIDDGNPLTSRTDLKADLKGSASHYIWRNHATSPTH